MRIQFVVMRLINNATELDIVKRFNTYELAEAYIMRTPDDLMGNVEHTIKKVFTNRRVVDEDE